MMKQRFFLARHGQTQWNVIKKLQGHLDSPMTEQGLEQAKLIAQHLANEQIGLIVSSELGRAKITAQICQQHLNVPLKFNQGLIERNFGSWQGKLFDQLKDEANFNEVFYQVTKHAPPNGESGLHCANRFRQTLIEIANQTRLKTAPQPILIITHGDLLRCLCEQLGQVSFVDAYSQYGNGAVFIVDYDFSSQQLTPVP